MMMILFFIKLAFAATTFAHELTGTIYDKEDGKMMFKYLRQDQPMDESGDSSSDIFYKDMEGKEALVEKIKFKNGKVTQFNLEQKQLVEVGQMIVTEDKIQFSYTKEGKTKTAEEKLKGVFVVGPTIVSLLRENWSKILAGETLDVRFGVFDRLETVGFSFRMEKEEKWKEQQTVVVKMKPSSWVIAAIVDPLYFRLTKSDPKILSVQGRVNPKQKVDNKWKDLNGYTLYDQSKAIP